MDSPNPSVDVDAEVKVNTYLNTNEYTQKSSARFEISIF